MRSSIAPEPVTRVGSAATATRKGTKVGIMKKYQDLDAVESQEWCELDYGEPAAQQSAVKNRRQVNERDISHCQRLYDAAIKKGAKEMEQKARITMQKLERGLAGLGDDEDVDANFGRLSTCAS